MKGHSIVLGSKEASGAGGAAAELFSWLAYSLEKEATKRHDFLLALRVSALELASERGSPLQLLCAPRSVILHMAKTTPSERERVALDGLARLKRRLRIAQFVIVRRFCEAVEGAKHRPLLVDGFSPTVNNMVLIAGRTLGYSDESAKTLQSRHWGDCRPVWHALSALNYCWQDWELHDPKFRPPKGVNEVPVNPLVFMADDDRTFAVVDLAEKFRLSAAHVQGIKLQPDDMIAFSLV